MTLQTLPLCIVLIGLALYVVLGGADFGAALWELSRDARLRHHAHESMAPVWEANHVWLIFVLTVTWTAYPTAFGSIASTLCIPLFLAGLGIIARGAAYALRGGVASERMMRGIDGGSAFAAVLTPFCLGAAIGGIASGRVPVGNAAGDLWSSWLNPTSAAIGVIAVANTAYIAAVFLAGDAQRREDDVAEEAFRTRALICGALSGVLALLGLVVLHGDDRELFDGLIGGAGTIGVVVSVLAGAVTMALIRARRPEPARLTAGLAVAAIIAGWALAQEPEFLPGLTVRQAAAPDDTLIAVLVAVAFGAIVLFPSLVLLFRLALGGRLAPADESAAVVEVDSPAGLLAASRDGLLGRIACGCFVAGLGFLTVADAGWAHSIGVVAFAGFLVLGFFAAVPALLVEPRDTPAG